ncbi:MAG: hypothetical protein IKN65_00750 [Clostridia bacterium]|nr:hypothetical protein [Clostridia bacterium]
MKNNLDMTSLILQIYSVVLLLQDYNNRDLMQELQIQDEKYLKTIIKQNQEILNLLRKEDNNAREVRKEN